MAHYLCANNICFTTLLFNVLRQCIISLLFLLKLYGGSWFFSPGLTIHRLISEIHFHSAARKPFWFWSSMTTIKRILTQLNLFKFIAVWLAFTCDQSTKLNRNQNKTNKQKNILKGNGTHFWTLLIQVLIEVTHSYPQLLVYLFQIFNKFICHQNLSNVPWNAKHPHMNVFKSFLKDN